MEGRGPKRRCLALSTGITRMLSKFSLLLLFCFTLFAVLTYLLFSTGESFIGQNMKVTGEHKEVAELLQQHVRALSEEIGIRNTLRPQGLEEAAK